MERYTEKLDAAAPGVACVKLMLKSGTVRQAPCLMMLTALCSWQLYHVPYSRAAPPTQVVCTIHQLSSDITDRFDDLLLLAGGKTAYFGPWSDAVDHFSRLGFQ